MNAHPLPVVAFLLFGLLGGLFLFGSAAAAFFFAVLGLGIGIGVGGHVTDGE